MDHKKPFIEIENGFILLLDKGGRIQEIPWAPSRWELQMQKPLVGVLIPEDRRNFLHLLQELPPAGSITGKGFSFRFRGEDHYLQIWALCQKENRILLVAFRDLLNLLYLYEALVKEKSPHLPNIRKLLIAHLTKGGTQEEELYNQISGLNNHLINLQRDLMKKNKTLDIYSQKVEKANRKMQQALDQLEEDFQKGKRLHQRFFPSSFPKIPGITFASFYQSVTGIGGDFYNIIPLNQEILIYLADVSGHGLDGAMINIFLRGSINSYLLSRLKAEQTSPQKIINHVYREYLNEDFPEDSFLCLLLGVLDIGQFTFTFSNAGFQVPPFLLQKNQLETPINRGMPISKTMAQLLSEEGVSPSYQEVKLSLSSPTTLLLSTDGLVEQRNKDQFFGEERIKETLLKNRDLSPTALTEALIEKFHAFRKTEQIKDDITFLVIRKI